MALGSSGGKPGGEIKKFTMEAKVGGGVRVVVAVAPGVVVGGMTGRTDGD
jgi:hypothetical protein